MKTKLWLVTIIMIAAFALSACSPAALSSTGGAAPASAGQQFAAGRGGEYGARFQERSRYWQRRRSGSDVGANLYASQSVRRRHPRRRESGGDYPACRLTIRDRAYRKRKR